MDQIKVGKFLTFLRKEKGITQIQLAEELNVTHQAVSKWETGESIPDINVLMNLAKYYKISVDEILNGDYINNEIKQEVKKESNSNFQLIRIIKVFCSLLLFTSFFLKYYQFETETNIIISGFPGIFPSTNQNNEQIILSFSGFQVLFHSTRIHFLFIGVFLLFLGTLSLLSLSIIELLEAYNVTNLLSSIKKDTFRKICLVIFIISGLGALIVMVQSFQIGIIIATLSLIGYILLNNIENKILINN